MKRDEGRDERDVSLSAQGDGLERNPARVPLLQDAEHAIVDRLDRRRDERAARVAKAWKERAMVEQMLDLDRDVVRDVGMASRGALRSTRRA